MQISFAKVLAFEEQCLSGGFGQGVRETIPEIESGGMASLPIIRVGLTGYVQLILADRLKPFYQLGLLRERPAQKG